jgi:hypothetical protein
MRVPEHSGMNTRYLIEYYPESKLPDWDIGNITALAAVKIIFETLGAYFISEETKEKQPSSET